MKQPYLEEYGVYNTRCGQTRKIQLEVFSLQFNNQHMSKSN